MSFPCYERYKDSGLEWLSEVPERWTICSLKQLGRLKGGAGFPHDQQGSTVEDIPFFKVNSLGRATTRGFLQEAENTISAETARELGAFIFPKDSIVFAKVGAALLLGRIRRLDTNACIDNNMMGLIPHENHSPTFLQYLMSTIRFEVLANPGAVPSVNSEQLGEWGFAIPTLQEQETIAYFLETETEKIDELIEEQRQLIALLKEKRQSTISNAVTKGINFEVKMKDSGVEWLGDTPAHWKSLRMASIYKEIDDLGVEGLPILSVSIHHGVSDKQLDDEELDRKVTRSDDQTKYKRVCPGDLVYNMMRAWQGGFGTVNVEGMVSPAYVVARPAKGVSSRFIELLLRTDCAIEEMRRYSQGVTDFRLRLYWDKFKCIRLSIPPPSEQEEILNYVEIKTAEFDRLTQTSERAIAILQERRTALISAAVTGKIDVRKYIPKEAA